MIWQSWGHSQSTPAPGELSLANPNPRTQYETQRVAAWFDHYLKGHTATSTGPQFSYFRDWVHYKGIATPAYKSASHFPVGNLRTFYLGNKTLSTSSKHIDATAQSFVTPAAGAPTSLNRVDVVGSYSKQGPSETDSPANSATWDGTKLNRAMVVVGSPRLTLKVDSPTAAGTQSQGPGGQLVLFVKVKDVAANGSGHLIKALEAPIRVANVSKPFTVQLPGIVHRFAKGHHLELIVASGSPNYRGGMTSNPVSIAGGAGQRLVLPVTQG
jgi:ABC-2 type transport system ATP-binding protein